VSFLLDTNVVSEWVKQRPDPGVVEWLAKADEDRIFLSVVTFAELRRGISLLLPGRRRASLERWLAGELPARFEGRVLPVDEETAVTWGDIVAARQKAGRPVAAMDGLIAATARVHDLDLVTRNTRDFEGSVRATLNPWLSG
jgi:predicted nucleic acid-binding protein